MWSPTQPGHLVKWQGLPSVCPLIIFLSENNSLKVIFTHFEAICALKILGKEGLSQGIACEFRIFKKIYILECFGSEVMLHLVSED